MKNIGMVAGEVSGDLLGAGLLSALKKYSPELIYSTGIGGAAMCTQDFTPLYEMDRLSVMGLVEPLFRLPELFRIRRGLISYFTQNKPDVFIGIDSPDFNLGLEFILRQLDIPVIHYVSPSVWAWRKNRIKKIAAATDLVLTLFPFEAAFYEKEHVPVKFVGHPLADLIPLECDQIAAQKKLHLKLDNMYVALLPGSRRNEIKYLAKLFIQTAMCVAEKRPSSQIEFITSAVNQEINQAIQSLCQEIAPDLKIQYFVGQSHDVMAAADVVLVTSGTATLETMLHKKPMVIAYKMAGLTYQIAKYAVKIPFIGLPNLLANELLVPEFIQHAVKPIALSAALFDFIDHPEKTAQLKEKFLFIHKQLRCDANQQAAQAVSALLQ